MTLTRGNVETILVARVGGWMTDASLDAVTKDGNNADLNGPIGTAVLQIGGTVSDLTAVADADVSTVDSGDYAEFLDIAELQAMQAIRTNFRKVDTQIGPRRQNFGQLLDAIRMAIKDKREQINDLYGSFLPDLEAGNIVNEFAMHNDDPESD